MLPTFELLPTPIKGNVRSNAAGKLFHLEEGTHISSPDGDGVRMMNKNLLFDPLQPNFNLHEWTVRSKSSPADTKGRLSNTEFRAMVCALVLHEHV